MRTEDWPAVSAIYEQGIAGRQATFETDVPDWDAWSRSHLADHRLVAVEDEQVVGWAALAPVSQRECYSGVDREQRLRGVERARSRYRTGPARTARRRRRSLVASGRFGAGVFPENEASVALHLACGFHAVGTSERLARLDGEWRDVLFLERRSEEV